MNGLQYARESCLFKPYNNGGSGGGGGTFSLNWLKRLSSLFYEVNAQQEGRTRFAIFVILIED